MIQVVLMVIREDGSALLILPKAIRCPRCGRAAMMIVSTCDATTCLHCARIEQ